MRRIILFGILLLLLPLALAANDPGHDTLYIEQTGDSVLTGNLNISSDLRVAQRIYSDYLEVRGDSTVTGTNRIIGSNGYMQIESTGGGVVYIFKDVAGEVRVGTPSQLSTLNVSGTIYQDNTRVCLANGTDCIGGNNTGNVSSIIAGNGISVSSATGDVTISANAVTCTGGEFSTWTGSAWTCGTPGSGTDDQTLQEVTSFGATTTDAITIDSDGNENTSIGGRLGIGTTGPTSKLHINGVSGNAMLELTGTTFTSYWGFGANEDVYIRSGVQDGTVYIQDNTGYVDIGAGDMYINTSSGNIGIGTTGPATLLEVESATSTASEITVQAPSYDTLTMGVDSSGAHLKVASTSAMRFYNNGAESMRIINGGNVGIGDTDPRAGLTIAKSGSVWNALSNTYPFPPGNIFQSIGTAVAAQDNWLGMYGAYGATSGSANVLLQAGYNNFNQQAGNYIGSEVQSATASDLTFGKLVGDSTNGGNASKTEFMRIDSSGNVGIGIASPSVPLHVNKATNGAVIVVDTDDSKQPTIAFAKNGVNEWLIGRDRFANTARDFFIYDVTAGLGRFFIDASGQIGISDDIPDSLLEVSASAGALDLFMLSSNDDNDGDLFIVKNSGNVGIGTTSPGEKLEVNGDIKQSWADGYFGWNYTAGGIYTTGMRMVGTRTLDLFNNMVSGSNGITFTTGAGAGSERMRIDTSGFVGIGTITPATKLDVNGTVTSNAFTATGASTGLVIIRDNAADDTRFVGDLVRTRSDATAPGAGMVGMLAFGLEAFTDNTVRRPSSIKWGWEGAQTNDNTDRDSFLAFSTSLDDSGGGGGGSERMRITSTGNVGIGTANPTAQTEIYSTGTPTLRLNKSGGIFDVYNDGSAHMKGEGSASGGLYLSGTKVGLRSTADGSNTLIANNGSIGIGTNSPSEKLHVVGNVTADAYFYNSDERLKENIQVIEDPITKLQNIRGVSFDWKKGGSTYGIIAQDVEKVFPELVKESPGGFKRVQGDGLIAPLIEAVKEQQKTIETQQLQTNKQQQTIESQQEELLLLRAQQNDQQAELAILKELLCTTTEACT